MYGMSLAYVWTMHGLCLVITLQWFLNILMWLKQCPKDNDMTQSSCYFFSGRRDCTMPGSCFSVDGIKRNERLTIISYKWRSPPPTSFHKRPRDQKSELDARQPDLLFDLEKKSEVTKICFNQICLFRSASCKCSRLIIGLAAGHARGWCHYHAMAMSWKTKMSQIFKINWFIYEHICPHSEHGFWSLSASSYWHIYGYIFVYVAIYGHTWPYMST